MNNNIYYDDHIIPQDIEYTLPQNTEINNDESDKYYNGHPQSHYYDHHLPSLSPRARTWEESQPESPLEPLFFRATRYIDGFIFDGRRITDMDAGSTVIGLVIAITAVLVVHYRGHIRNLWRGEQSIWHDLHSFKCFWFGGGMMYHILTLLDSLHYTFYLIRSTVESIFNGTENDIGSITGSAPTSADAILSTLPALRKSRSANLKRDKNSFAMPDLEPLNFNVAEEEENMKITKKGCEKSENLHARNTDDFHSSIYNESDECNRVRRKKMTTNSGLPNFSQKYVVGRKHESGNVIYNNDHLLPSFLDEMRYPSGWLVYDPRIGGLILKKDKNRLKIGHVIKNRIEHAQNADTGMNSSMCDMDDRPFVEEKKDEFDSSLGKKSRFNTKHGLDTNQTDQNYNRNLCGKSSTSTPSLSNSI